MRWLGIPLKKVGSFYSHFALLTIINIFKYIFKNTISWYFIMQILHFIWKGYIRSNIIKQRFHLYTKYGIARILLGIWIIFTFEAILCYVIAFWLSCKCHFAQYLILCLIRLASLASLNISLGSLCSHSSDILSKHASI